MTSTRHRASSSGRRLLTTSIVLSLAILLALATLAIQPAHAQTFTVLYSFTGGADGATPFARLVRDTVGNLYGTTYSGGAYQFGTIFQLDPSGNETVLYSFTGAADGGLPYAGITLDAAGNFYGATYVGGDLSCNAGAGCGTVYKLNASGNYTVLHTFAGVPDGVSPSGDLIQDASGNLYGTTQSGGALNWGTIFKLDASGNESVLYSFDFAGQPYAGLIRDSAGNLYGTTRAGGTNAYGTVFKLDTVGNQTVLHAFDRTSGGIYPYSRLLADPAGNLYGTTSSGFHHFGGGTVFELNISKEKGRVLYAFGGKEDGGQPAAGVIRDHAGNLYGTTQYGGDTSCNSGVGCGIVFKLDKFGNQTVLHTFTGGADGKFVLAALISDSAGTLYGTTWDGGAYGWGVVFKITP